MKYWTGSYIEGGACGNETQACMSHWLLVWRFLFFMLERVVCVVYACAVLRFGCVYVSFFTGGSLCGVHHNRERVYSTLRVRGILLVFSSPCLHKDVALGVLVVAICCHRSARTDVEVEAVIENSRSVFSGPVSFSCRNEEGKEVYITRPRLTLLWGVVRG